MTKHQKTPDDLVAFDGVLYACILADAKSDPPLGAVGSAGLGQYAELCNRTVRLLGCVPHGTDDVRVMLDEICVSVMRSGSNIVALVMVKGHPIIKSSKRMMRRALKRLPTPEPVAEPAPVYQQGQAVRDLVALGCARDRRDDCSAEAAKRASQET